MQQLVMSERTRGVDDILKFFNVTKRYVGDGSKCTKFGVIYDAYALIKVYHHLFKGMN